MCECVVGHLVRPMVLYPFCKECLEPVIHNHIATVCTKTNFLATGVVESCNDKDVLGEKLGTVNFRLMIPH